MSSWRRPLQEENTLSLRERDRVRVGLFPALPAQPVYLQLVCINGKSMNPRNLLLMLLNIAVFKLDDLAAFCANKMVVVFICLYNFKPGTAFPKLLLLRNTKLA